MLKDDARIKGIVNLVLRDEHGRVKQHKTIRNKVTDYGLAHIVGRMIDPQQDIRGTHVIPAMMSHMSIGTGTSPARTHDRMLQTEPTTVTRVQVMRDTSLDREHGDFSVTFTHPSSNATSGANTSGQDKIECVSSVTNRKKIRVGMVVEATNVPVDTRVLAITNANGNTLVQLSRNLTGAVADGATVKFEYIGYKRVDSTNRGKATEKVLTQVGQTAEDGFDSAPDLGASLINNAGGIYHPFQTDNVTPVTAATVADFQGGAAQARGHIGGFYDPADGTFPPFFGESADANTLDSSLVQFGTSVDGIFQGLIPAGSSSIIQDPGVGAEGYGYDENDYGQVATPETNPSNTATAKPGTKKTGNRIVYVATFKASNPNQNDTAVTEAGIFNRRNRDDNASAFDTRASFNSSPATITGIGGETLSHEKLGFTGKAITQSMLCRTVFNVVNKASADTLQITWSIQLSDQTT